MSFIIKAFCPHKERGSLNGIYISDVKLKSMQ